MKNIEISFIRHAQSLENRIKDILHEGEEFQLIHKYFQEQESLSKVPVEIQKALNSIKNNIVSFSIPYVDSDIPLSKKGVAQAENTGEYLKKEELAFDMILFSPFIRTQGTLEIIQNTHVEITKEQLIDFRLIEKCMPQLLRLCPPCYFLSHPEESKKIKSQYQHLYFEHKAFDKFNNFDSILEDVLPRTKQLVEEIKKGIFGKKIALISHQGTLMSIQAHIENKTKKQIPQYSSIKKCRSKNF